MKNRLMPVIALAGIVAAGQAFALSNQEISITNHLTVSGQPTPLTFIPEVIVSKSSIPGQGQISCTLSGSAQNLCQDLNEGSDRVKIPFGQTLKIDVYPTPIEPGSNTFVPGVLQWDVAYTQGHCGVKSPTHTSNPGGSMNPPNIDTTVNGEDYFDGGSTYCHP